MKMREIYWTQLTVAGVVAGIGALTSCSSNELGSTYSSSVSPTPLGAKVLGAELAPCTEPVRPLRIAFIIDNTGSNNAYPEDVQVGPDYSGTDPVKSLKGKLNLLNKDLSFLTENDVYTDRQMAVFLGILKLQKVASDARSKNQSYRGIDVGVAHFPYAPEGQKRGDFNNIDLSRFVLHNGSGTGLSDLMTDVSKVEQSDSWKRELWNMLKFTHSSHGMTPYTTAFDAGQKLLISSEAKKAEDDRPGLMVLVTDGLPTDQKPSSIYSSREALGTDTRVVVMSIFQANVNEDEQNKPARDALAKMYAEDGWGQEEHSNFNSYWSALKEVPKSPKIRDDEFAIESKNLLKSMDQLLDRYIKCKSSAD